MGLYTAEQAREHLNAWLAADLALATSKEYRMGTRMLTRTNAAEVKERIAFWAREVTSIGTGTSNARRKKSRRVIPID